ncbi:hypothetical protein [Coleofasciculus sp. F4-SAH-05]
MTSAICLALTQKGEVNLDQPDYGTVETSQNFVKSLYVWWIDI